MTKVVQTTSRGQITIPKEMRDKFGTTYIIISSDDSITLKPLNIATDELTREVLKAIENEWKAYKKGEYVELKDIAKEYGL